MNRTVVDHVEVSPGVTLEVGLTGSGERPIVLVHGFPHTRQLWRPVLELAPQEWRAVTPDLRGCGGSTRAAAGYDALSVSRDLLALIDVLGLDRVDLVAIDAGVAAAFLLAIEHPGRVRRLVLVEASLAALLPPEAPRPAAPWWFGFHQVPGLAEAVVEGHEPQYLDFFYRTGILAEAGIDPEIREAFLRSFAGRESLRCAFEYYRSMPQTDHQVREATTGSRLTTPTLAVGAGSIGGLLHRQLSEVADDLRGEIIPDCGHIVPLDRPPALVALLVDFLGGERPRLG